VRDKLRSHKFEALLMEEFLDVRSSYGNRTLSSVKPGRLKMWQWLRHVAVVAAHVAVAVHM
jgi:hypothetical protein